MYPRSDIQVNQQELLPLYETGFYKSLQGLEGKFTTVHPRTRVSFMTAFGITPPEQRSLEQHFSKARIRWSNPGAIEQWSVGGEGEVVSTLCSH